VILEPCVRAEAGVLEGAGSGILPARDQRPPWMALGVAGRARWLVAGQIFLELDAGARFPLGVGPFVMFSLGQYVNCSYGGALSLSGNCTIQQTAMHEWLTLGVRGAYDINL
jgi:hypothetical protein